MAMKKGVSLILTSILAMSLVAGCSKNGETAEATQSAGKDANKPLKFSMSISNNSNTYAAGQKDITQEKWVKELEKRTNTDIDLKLITLKDFDAKMSVMFASGDIPDVVQNVGGVTSKSMSGSVQAGVFMPLDDLLKEYAPNLMKQVPKEAWDEVSYDGKIYGIPNWLDNPARRATFIRTDLLKETGLPVPKTVDEFLDVLRAFKKLGVEHPYQGRDSFKYADVLFGAYDALGYQFMLQGDQVVPKFFDVENMTNAINAYKTMYEEGLMAKDFATIDSNTFFANINSGKVGIWSSNADGLVGFRTLKSIIPTAKVDIIPSPVGPDGYSGYGLYGSTITSVYINSKVDKERAIGIIKFFDWMLSDEAEMLFSFGIEGQNYTVTDSKIDYKAPQTDMERSEEQFRDSLWFVHDSTLNRKRTEIVEGGQDLLKAFDETLAKEGVGGISFSPDLETFKQYPDLAAKSPNQSPKIIVDHIVKMIYGKEDVADWPKVIEEYKKKGGDEIIKEATERYNKKDGVLIQESRKK